MSGVSIQINQDQQPLLSAVVNAQLTAASQSCREVVSAVVLSDWSFDEMCESLASTGMDLVFRVNDRAVIYQAQTGAGPAVVLVENWADTEFHVTVFAETRVAAANVANAVKALTPPKARITDDGVEMTFWSNGAFGPQRFVRRVASLRWAETSRNYPEAARASLNELVAWRTAPPLGRLIVFHGPPGTGKSRFLQTLATEWLDWCDIHYIVDPDEFFGHGSYMRSVMLGDRYDIDERWRLVVIEDGDEFIRLDGKDRLGQGVARLLNAADGLIGQGLRVMLLISTNVRDTAFNPAIVRPGRCAALVKFPLFPAAEASQWLADTTGSTTTVDSDSSLARLYLLASGA